MHRIWFRWLTICLALLVSVPVSSQLRPRLVVYLHTNIRARALEAALQNQMPAIDVVVCSRHRDFERELAQGFDAALATQPVLRSHNLPIDMRGTRGGDEREPYVLLSIATTIDKSEFPRLTVGAVDLLGREKTAAFVANLLGIKSPPEIKFVIKSEDLLPLLQFGTARAVLVSEREATNIKGLTKLDLRQTPLPERVGIAAVSFRSDAARRSVRPALEAMDADTRRKLGVDAWR
jgi:hypothetical protein